MPKKIKITAGEVEMEAQLNDSQTAKAIWDALPIQARGNTWGDEIYFSIPVQAKAENPTEEVEVGDLGYWPPGHAFCIFFGPTPVSSGPKPKPASAVNPLGKVLGDPKAFKKVRSGTEIKLERAE
jgi:hypothetical protein